ncbi:MAG TPA: PAS domain S-box protein [Desulfosporosinus sp.]
MELNARVQIAFNRLENLSQCNLPSHELTSKLLSELNTALHELQSTAVELLEQNEEMAASRQTLEDERRRYQELFEFSPDGYLVTDTEGIMLAANSAAIDLFNVSKSLLIGKPLAMFVHSEEYLTFRTQLEELKKGTIVRKESWELVMLTGKRTTFPVSITVGKVIASRGGTAELRWSLRDITKRLRNEEILKESERQFRNAIDNAPIPILLQAEDGEVIKLSRVWTEMTGYTLEEIPTILYELNKEKNEST